MVNKSTSTYSNELLFFFFLVKWNHYFLFSSSEMNAKFGISKFGSNKAELILIIWVILGNLSYNRHCLFLNQIPFTESVHPCSTALSAGCQQSRAASCSQKSKKSWLSQGVTIMPLLHPLLPKCGTNCRMQQTPELPAGQAEAVTC